MKLDNIAPAAVFGVVLVGGYLLWRGLSKVGQVAGDVAGAVVEGASQAAHVADGVIAAPVLAAGDAVGLPRTDETECERALREGRTWDASFACPASDFLGYIFSTDKPAPKPAPVVTESPGSYGTGGGWSW